jgi:Dolichyl-phosphate-mannose-protein mannosyltransferase
MWANEPGRIAYRSQEVAVIRPSCAPSLRQLVLLLMVAGLVFVVAADEYAHFLDVHRSLWGISTHDRNAHYLYALRLATALRHGEIIQLVDQILKARVWPPLHGMVCGLLLSVVGLDYRLAVLPSLLGWAGTAFFAFLTARRSLSVGGTVAGLVAVLFLLVSPLHRSYSTDIMLESLGACLTLASLYAYLVAVQDDTPTAWRNLALVLSLFFLHKYNYWMIVAGSLVLSELSRRPGHYFSILRSLHEQLPLSTLRSLLFDPLNYLILLLAGVVAWVVLRGDVPLELAGRSIRLYPPENVLSAMYALFVVQIFRWWRRGREWIVAQDVSVRQVLLWHAWPIALFLALPKHISAFAWFLSPVNKPPAFHSTWMERLDFYTQSAIVNYHIAPWSAILAVGLFILAIASIRRLRPGAHAVVLVASLGALLTVTHPNTQGRFLHSWIGAFWLSAGFGAVSLAGVVEALRWRRSLALAATLAGLAVVIAHLPALTQPRRSTDGGPAPNLPSLLDVTDSYALDLDQANRATVLSVLPIQPLAQWTTLERHGRLDRLEEHWYGFADGAVGEANRSQFRAWLAHPTCDTLVFVDRLATGGGLWDRDADMVQYHAELRDLLTQQHTFHLVRDVPFPQQGCRVQVWKKGGAVVADR